MEELFATGVAGVNRPHRVHHVIVTINFVDERDARLSVFVRASNNAVPNVGRENHSRLAALLQLCNLKDRAFTNA